MSLKLSAKGKYILILLQLYRTFYASKQCTTNIWYNIIKIDICESKFAYIIHQCHIENRYEMTHTSYILIYLHSWQHHLWVEWHAQLAPLISCTCCCYTPQSLGGIYSPADYCIHRSLFDKSIKFGTGVVLDISWDISYDAKLNRSKICYFGVKQ